MSVYREKEQGKQRVGSRVSCFLYFGLILWVGWFIPNAAFATQCDSDYQRCVAGVSLDCGLDSSTDSGMRCESGLPVPTGDLTKFNVTLTWPGKAPVEMDVLSTFLQGSEQDALSFSFPPPQDLPENAIFDSQIAVEWGTADFENRGQISVAHAIGVDGFLAIRPTPLLPNANLNIRVMGPRVADFVGATLRCPPAGDRANPLITLNEAVEVEAKTIGVRVFSAGPVWFPVGTPPLGCTLEGRLRGWPIAVPLKISVARPQTNQVLMSDRSFVSPGDELRVVAFGRDEKAGTLSPLKDVEVRGAWIQDPARRKKEKTAKTAESGGAILKVPVVRLGKKPKFRMDWRWYSEDQALSERVLGGVPERTLDTRFPVQLEPELLYPGQTSAVEVRAHLPDGAISSEKTFRAGFYWGGDEWSPSVVFDDMLVSGDGVWKQSVGFKPTVFWELESFGAAKGVALVVGKSPEGSSASSWGTYTYAPSPVWLRWLPPVEAGRDQFLMSRYDGSVVTGEPVFRSGEKALDNCRKESARRWSCPSFPRGDGGQLSVLSDGLEGKEYTSFSGNQPISAQGRFGTLRFLDAQVSAGEALKIEVRKAQSRKKDDKNCSLFLVLSSVDGTRIGGKDAWARCLDSDEPVQEHTLSGLSRRPGMVGLRALWFSSGGLVYEERANAMVLPQVPPQEMAVTLQEDRKIKVVLPKEKLSNTKLLLWISDSLDPNLHDLRADHIAAAAMGVRPPEGHVLLTSGLQHPAGWLTQSVDADSDNDLLELPLSAGYALPVPLHKSDIALAAPGQESDTSSIRLFEAWLEEWSDRWDETRRMQDDSAACLDSFPMRAFQRNFVEDRLGSIGIFDMRISLRRGAHGVEGFNILWFGSDRKEGTHDDLGYYFGAGCGGAYNFTLSAVRPWDSQPRIERERSYSGPTLPYGSRKIWLSFMDAVEEGVWLSPGLDPGRWWVHAVAFDQGRLKMASTRELRVPHAERPVPDQQEAAPSENP